MKFAAAVLTVELYSVGLAAVFLIPVALIQALSGRWAGVAAYARAACWGGAFLVAGDVAIRGIVG